MFAEIAKFPQIWSLTISVTDLQNGLLIRGRAFSAHKDAPQPPPLLPSTTALVIKDVSPHTNEWIKHLSRARFANHRLTTDQCDQI